MKYADLVNVISQKRMERYLTACKGRKRKAMNIYNSNVTLAKETYVVVNYFEIALRNAINNRLKRNLGDDWLRDSVMSGGIFDNRRCEKMKKIIFKRYSSLLADGEYSHSKLLSSLEFGVWKYMFADFQFRVTGRVLLDVFLYRPASTACLTYDNTYFFNELHHINILRNRIAHQEPICFSHNTRLTDTRYIRSQHRRIMQLFTYMGIDGRLLLKGMDNIGKVCDEIDNL